MRTSSSATGVASFERVPFSIHPDTFFDIVLPLLYIPSIDVDRQTDVGRRRAKLKATYRTTLRTYVRTHQEGEI